MTSDPVFNPDLNFWRLRVSALSQQSISELLAFVRAVKQTDATMVVIDFTKDVSNGHPNESRESSYLLRLNWSKKGQLLTNIIRNSGVPFVAVISHSCFYEYFELALACHFLVWKKGIDAGLGPDGEFYFPRWGALRRFNEWFGEVDSMGRLLSCRHRDTEEAIRSKPTVYTSHENTVDAQLTELLKQLDQVRGVARRLSILSLGENPLDPCKQQFIETTIYANDINDFPSNRIKFVESRSLNLKKIDEEIAVNEDDFGIDYIPFDFYPEKELAILDRKERLKQVDLLVNQDVAPIKGRCIELGSGAGYFSAILSRKIIG